MRHPWTVITAILIGAILIYVFVRRQGPEGFVASPLTAYADAQATYFDDVVDKGLIVSPGLDSKQINDALYQPDLYMPVSKDRDYSTYFIEDPTLKYMNDDEKFCRGARHPRDLKQRDPLARTGCGWYFKSDASTPSIGALGTRDGPIISNNLAGGVWIWNVAEAAKKEDIKMCKRVKSCDLMSVEGVKGKCGFCERLGYAVPANADGSDKYPEDVDGSCGQKTVMDASSCSKPAPMMLVTSDGIECENYGRPSADGSKRLYTQAECDALNGIYTPDGKCASRGGGSYSDMCRALNDPAQATPTLCTPNALGNLSRDCLKSLAVGLGYNKSGAIIRVLETGTAPTETDRNAVSVLRGAGVAIPDAVFSAGNIDTTSAGTVYQRIFNAITGGATPMIREAAKWLVTGSNAFDVCDFGSTQRGPFPLTCLQRAFRQAGCQPAGAQHPTETSARTYASMSWGDVNAVFKQTYANMKSADSSIQDKALTSCLGLKYAREPPKTCPMPPTNV